MTKAQTVAVVELLAAVAEVIRTAGEIPSGHLYAAMMGKVDIHTYNAMLRMIKGSGLVVEKNHLLVWVGPKF
jgi:hypothetical protein